MFKSTYFADQFYTPHYFPGAGGELPFPPVAGGLDFVRPTGYLYSAALQWSQLYARLTGGIAGSTPYEVPLSRFLALYPILSISGGSYRFARDLVTLLTGTDPGPVSEEYMLGILHAGLDAYS